ncbi:hypothetical protein [Luteibacter yeojuensis]|uniref:Uncharacterized protein n=1 Tax=Luteibacter yeojuensis TaxID=345309 RepID=A0A0F3KNF0_9GAMM|nr:hypothetical protein [Luteibacter yeojuensis]KJV32512.1 hypothetical protein VI08_12305 [Luteibacter yeojuensis]
MASDAYQEYPVADAFAPGLSVPADYAAPSSPAELVGDAVALLAALRAADLAEAAFCANRVRGAALDNHSDATRAAAEALEYALIACGDCDAGPVFRAFQALVWAMTSEGWVATTM